MIWQRGFLTMARKQFGAPLKTLDAMGETLVAGESYAGKNHHEVIAIEKIELDIENPRQLCIVPDDIRGGVSEEDFDFERKTKEIESIRSLSESIKSEGVLNPVIVYKEGGIYKLVAGERRVLASTLAEIPTVPVKILPEKPDPARLAVIQWVENMEREGLSLWEKIRNIEKILVAMGSEYPYQEISPTSLGKALGYSKQRASIYLNIARGSELLKHSIQEGTLSNIKTAALIATAPENMHSELLAMAFNGLKTEGIRNYLNAPKQELKKTNTPLIEESKITKIKFGETKNLRIAKEVLLAILETIHPEAMKAIKEAVNWDDTASINQAFRDVVRYLETTEANNA